LIVLLAAAPAIAGVLSLNPNGACCPGCGSPDDPLGPRYRGDAITGLSSPNPSARPLSIAALSATNSPARPSSVALTNATAAVPSEKTNAVPEFIVSNGEKYLAVSFAQLADFSIRTTPEVPGVESDSLSGRSTISDQVPRAIKSLGEKAVALTGFMLPVQAKDGLTTDFLLLRNQSACCYGVMPKMNEWTVVRTSGKGVKVTMDTPVTVLGTFHVGETRENGTLTSVYQLDCDRLINSKD
jgi:hypothetical protein